MSNNVPVVEHLKYNSEASVLPLQDEIWLKEFCVMAIFTFLGNPSYLSLSPVFYEALFLPPPLIGALSTVAVTLQLTYKKLIQLLQNVFPWRTRN